MPSAGLQSKTLCRKALQPDAARVLRVMGGELSGVQLRSHRTMKGFCQSMLGLSMSVGAIEIPNAAKGPSLM